MSANDVDRMANSVDPDQTALGAVWSGSALFAQTCLSENLGKLWYLQIVLVVGRRRLSWSQKMEQTPGIWGDSGLDGRLTCFDIFNWSLFDSYTNVAKC